MIVSGIAANDLARDLLQNNSKIQESDFKELLDKITGGEIAEEIRKNYNVTLDIGNTGNYQQLLKHYDMQCKNYVGISRETLARMEENPALKEKVLNAIEEFCSPKEQAKMQALQPPVKSAGMIICPDGSAFYWLEGYSCDSDEINNKKRIITGQSTDQLYCQYEKMDDFLTKKDLQAVMGILASEYRKK